MNEIEAVNTARRQRALASSRVTEQAAVLKRLLFEGRDTRKARKALSHLELVADLLHDHLGRVQATSAATLRAQLARCRG